MLYECYRCEKLTNQEEGIIIHSRSFSPFLFRDIVGMVFICKNCLSKKGKEKFEKARKK